jgi:gliding motility-associated-like protein
MCIKKHICLIFFFFTYTYYINAQITANPSFNGCIPFSVVLSGVPGATAEFWDLGPGMGTSTLSSLSPVYITPGTYNITYTAMVNGVPVSHQAQIGAMPKPVVSFGASLPGSHCSPMTVTFSASGASPGSTYSWAFGDLSPIQTGQTISHTYVGANSYQPILIVFDAASSCTTTANSSLKVHVSDLPNLLIGSSDGFSACQPPLVTMIDGSASSSGSPLGGGLTYSWSFNAGSPGGSSSATPGQVTFGSGLHVISLTATDNNQCTHTKTVGVSVVSPTLLPVFAPTVCVGATVPGTVHTNQSQVMFDVDGKSFVFQTVPGQSNEMDSVFYITTPGQHNVFITVQTPGCPKTTVVEQVFVEEVIADFTWPPPGVTCHSLMTATYINQSTTNSGSALTFTWRADSPPNASHYGTPASSVITGPASPTFTFAQGSLNPYTIYKYYQPYITLEVESNSIAKCTATVEHEAHVLARPTAMFFTDIRKGCAPLEVEFLDHSYTHADLPITSYTWNNGSQSSPVTATGTLSTQPPNNVIPAFNHTYTSPGIYYPYLIIETVGGCRDVSYYDTIVVADHPVMNATFPPEVCAGVPVTIHMSGTSGVDHWHVQTDQYSFSGCITASTPTFPFIHPGIHQVIVTGYQAGCAGTATMVQTILVKGPSGKFRHETTCSGNRKVVKYHVTLQEAASAVLYFGDQNQVLITGNATGSLSTVITYTYANTGDYQVELVAQATNGCPPYVMRREVKVRDPRARITYSLNPLPSLPVALACTKAPFAFMADQSTDNDLEGGYFYTWYYNTPTYSLAPAIHLVKNKLSAQFGDPVALDTFRMAGTYTIGLMVRDVNSCTDSVSLRFRISEARPFFSMPSPICLSNGTFQVTNTTQSMQVPPDVITGYTWDFGDGSPQVSSADPDFNPVHAYQQAVSPSQTFPIMCVATNQMGCKDTTIKQIQVNNPKPHFSADRLFTCVRSNSFGLIAFSAYPGYTTYSVSYGDQAPAPPTWSTATTFSNVYHAYVKPGIYTPTLVIVDNAGCVARDSLKIQAIGQPTASILYPDGINGFCRPAQPILTSNSTAYVDSIYNYIWTVDGISSPPPGSPTMQTSYINPVVSVSLTVSVGNAFLCPHTATAQILTYSPIATPVISPTVLCLGTSLNAGIQIISDVAAWRWFFGDLVEQPVSYYTPLTPTSTPYTYTTMPATASSGNASITLVYYATLDMANTCVKAEVIPIKLIDIKSDFKHAEDNYAHCLNIPDSFTPTAQNLPELDLNYAWDFGDQQASTLAAPSHTYLEPGVYPVSLTIRDQGHACEAISVKEMTIHPLPTVTISTVGAVCRDATFQVMGQGTPGDNTGILTGTLVPDVTINNSVIFAPDNTFTTNVSLSESTDLFIRVTDHNHCENNSSAKHVSVQLPARPVHWDTTVVIGQPTPLNAFAGGGFSYTWTPLVDYLNCSTCLIHNPVSNTTLNITYTVQVEDSLRCTVVENTYRINISPRVSLDVPSAFTPNGDGVNDIIYADGWGLRRLNYFRVFNRWGQLLFESNDLSNGWDGFFQGVPQNMETYVYQVEAETFLDTEPVIFKTGTFKLIR